MSRNNKKRVIFLDRDGTLIVEPPGDYQVDSLDKLEFIPGVFRNLYQIRKNLDFKLVMVTNQDGLGTPSFPEENFIPSQIKILKAFENEGITFDDIRIDTSVPEDRSPARKPGTGLLKKFLGPSYDMHSSYVIGDRITDLELAKNLGANAIWFSDKRSAKKLKDKGLDKVCVLTTNNWDRIYDFLSVEERSARVKRKTGETDVLVELKLDGSGRSSVSTGLGFFDHMLEQIGRHSGCDLKIRVKGDLDVDEHHTIEDTAIALGQAFYQALGSKRGIERYGFALPMDDSMAQVLMDFGGRGWLVWDAEFKREKIGDMPTEMFVHFFKSFSDEAKCNLNIMARGTNEHHKIEAIFKAFARAIKMAVKRDPASNELPSTKGTM